MKSTTFQLIYLFPLIVIAQTFIFNNFNLLDSINPQIYILYFLILPITINQMGLLSIGFVMGNSIDLLLDLPATNTIASITVLSMRPLIVNLFYRKNQNKLIAENRMVKLYRNIWVVISIILLHQLVYFALDFSILKNFAGFFRNFILTSMMSFLVIWTLLGFRLYSDD